MTAPRLRRISFSPRQTWYIHCDDCGWSGPERVLPNGKGIENDKAEHNCPPKEEQ